MARGHGPLRELPLVDLLVFADQYEHIREVERDTVTAGVLGAVDKIDFR